MNARTRHALWAVLGIGAFLVLSGFIFRGYLTPDMMLYYLTFRWCF